MIITVLMFVTFAVFGFSTLSVIVSIFQAHAHTPLEDKQYKTKQASLFTLAKMIMSLSFFIYLLTLLLMADGGYERGYMVKVMVPSSMGSVVLYKWKCDVSSDTAVLTFKMEQERKKREADILKIKRKNHALNKK